MRDLLYPAFDQFLAAETANILNRVSERNLCGRLGYYLEDACRGRALKGYFSDPEYNRQKGGRIKVMLTSQKRGRTCAGKLAC